MISGETKSFVRENLVHPGQVRDRLFGITPQHRESCDAAFVHWTGNSGRDRPDTFQFAWRPSWRTLDRSRKLSRYLALHRRYRWRRRERNRFDAVSDQSQAVRGCPARPVQFWRAQAARGGGLGGAEPAVDRVAGRVGTADATARARFR